MGIVRWNPNLVNHVFDNFMNGDLPTQKHRQARGTLPAVNIKENDDQFELEVAVPGFAKDAFKIEVNEGVLTVTAEHEKAKETDTKKPNGYTRREFNYGAFSRRFTLPEDANDTEITANYESGILSIVLPKKEEAKPQPARLIEVA